MRRTLKSVKHRLVTDFGLGDTNTAKTAMGFGEGAMAAVSLFAMPAMDYTMSRRVGDPSH